MRFENGDVHRVTLRADRGEASYAGLLARVNSIAGESTPPWYFAYHDGDDLIAIASEPDFAEATRGRRQASLGIDRIEHDEQVRVDARSMHFVNTSACQSFI